jgi:DNA-binding NarL/FixJ family response regulator
MALFMEEIGMREERWGQRRRGEPWTSEEEQRLAHLLAAGKTVRNIAELLGRTQSAVHSRACIKGVVPKRARQEVRARVYRRRSADFFLS